jgi:hypothetical protein
MSTLDSVVRWIHTSQVISRNHSYFWPAYGGRSTISVYGNSYWNPYPFYTFFYGSKIVDMKVRMFLLILFFSGCALHKKKLPPITREDCNLSVAEQVADRAMKRRHRDPVNYDRKVSFSDSDTTCFLVAYGRKHPDDVGLVPHSGGDCYYYITKEGCVIKSFLKGQ